MQLAHDAGVPSPRVLHVLQPQDDLGTGFIMARVEGETIPRKILRDAQFARARPKLARQLGGVLAGIHGLALSQLPELRRMTAAKEIAELERDYRSFDWPRPVFELALRWLRDHDPGPSEKVTLVHGDFRHGNLIIGPDGLRAVLDWELAHTGDPMEDLGWICVNSWRFGEIDKPVGGFGSREELFAGYERRAAASIPRRVMFWEVMGTLRWGVMCCGMMQRFRIGPEHSVERAMIGRRASETEIDLLRLLAPRGRGHDMQDEPTPEELIRAVADFLRNDIAPEISGHTAFKLRVSINALDLVTRQLTLEQEAMPRKRRGLAQLAGRAGLARRTQSRAGRPDRRGRDRSADARPRRASVADHDGQARGRSAELCVVSRGSWAKR